MVQYMTTRLDTSFAALSDPTRRGVLEQLGRADASITDLAEKFRDAACAIEAVVGKAWPERPQPLDEEPEPEEMAADISHSQLVVLDKCGHMSPLEKPAEVSAALRRWLTE